MSDSISTSRSICRGRTVLLSMLTLFPQLVVSQPVVLRESSCRECSIRIVDSVSLGDADGLGTVGPIFTIARLGSRGYAVSHDANDAVILVFDSLGRFVQEVGRRGSGPGEYQFIRFLRAEGSRLHVFDGRLRRQTVLSAEFEVLHTAPLGGSLLGDALPLDSSNVVFNAVIPNTERAGLYLHAQDANGSVRSFDDHDGSPYRYDLEHVFRRGLSAAAGGALWSAYRTQYRVDKWRGGKIEQTLTRSPEWFRPHLRGGRPDPALPPAPTLRAVREDTDGRLWLLSAVADARWRSALGSSPEGVTYSDPNRYFDSIVEVVDPRRGEVLATLRMDQFLTEMPRAGEAAYFHEDLSGIPRIVVLKMAVTEPGTRRIQ